jgi:hypothetical protein
MSSATADDVNAVSGQLDAERTAQDVAGRIVVQPCHVTALMMSAIASVVTLVPLMEGNRAAEPARLGRAVGDQSCLFRSPSARTAEVVCASRQGLTSLQA